MPTPVLMLLAGVLKFNTSLRSVVLATPVTSGSGFYNQLFGGREPIAVRLGHTTFALRRAV